MPDGAATMRSASWPTRVWWTGSWERGCIAIKRCSALTAGGGRCQRTVSDGGEYCYAHDPARAEERTRSATRGGKSGGRGRAATGEIAELKAELRTLKDDVLGGR